MKLTFRVYPVGTGLLSEAEQNQIAVWHDMAFSDLSISKQYEWTVGGQFNILLDVNGKFSGFVGLMGREVLFDRHKKQIVGIRGLVIDPAWRNKGLGKLIMEEAHKVMFRTLKADYGVLLCLNDLKAFYSSLGWQPLRCRVLVENKGQKVRWSELAMILSRERTSDLEGITEIDLVEKAF